MPPGKPAHWRVYACFFTVGVAGVGGGTAEDPIPPVLHRTPDAGPEHPGNQQGQSILVTRGSSGNQRIEPLMQRARASWLPEDPLGNVAVRGGNQLLNVALA